MDQETLSELTRIAQRHLVDEGMGRIDICLDSLNEEQIWFQPNASSNSVGIILTHLVGNIRQYLVSGLGALPDTRERGREFDRPDRLSKVQLRARLASTLEEALTVLKGLQPGNLREPYHIQGFSLTFLEVVVHVMEHYSYHIGQIAYITKMLTDRQTGFYSGIDLTVRNRPQ
jgi:uncharacterized damage-inducible protein DinB